MDSGAGEAETFRSAKKMNEKECASSGRFDIAISDDDIAETHFIVRRKITEIKYI